MEQFEQKLASRNPMLVFITMGCGIGAVAAAALPTYYPSYSQLASLVIAPGALIGFMLGKWAGFSLKTNK